MPVALRGAWGTEQGSQGTHTWPRFPVMTVSWFFSGTDRILSLPRASRILSHNSLLPPLSSLSRNPAWTPAHLTLPRRGCRPSRCAAAPLPQGTGPGPQRGEQTVSGETALPSSLKSFFSVGEVLFLTSAWSSFQSYCDSGPRLCGGGAGGASSTEDTGLKAWHH